MRENVIAKEMKITLWRRLGVFFIDLLLIGGFYLLFFFAVGTPVLSTVEKDNIDIVNEIYKTECEKRDVPYKSGMYGFYELDKDAFIAEQTKTKTIEEAYTLYENTYQAIDEAITKYPDYSQAFGNFVFAYYLAMFLSSIIPTSVFVLLIPMLNKRDKTIGMMITKTCLAVDEDNYVAPKLRILGRYFVIYGIEMILPYILGKILGLALVVIFNVILMIFTKRKKGFHEVFFWCHVDKDKLVSDEKPPELPEETEGNIQE